MKKPKILAFVNNYIPSYRSGGPVRSVSNISSLVKNDIDISVVCYDRDAGDNKPFPGISSGEWNLGPNGQDILYLPASFFKWLRLLIVNIDKEQYDGIYLNTFFGIRYSLIPIMLYLLGILKVESVILAPRGEFMPGALGISKFKKMIYIYLFRGCGLSRSITFQCTSHDEVTSLKKFFPHAKQVLVENIPGYHLADFSRERDSFSDTIRLAYISRVTRKKNIAFLIEILKSYHGERHIILDIYGPANGKDKIYLEECMSVSKDSSNLKVSYKGPIVHECVQNCLKKYDFFVLPTLGENFGHAIADAILAGVPVIVSKFTAFKDVEEFKVGHIIDINSAEATRAKLVGVFGAYDYTNYDENSFREYAHYKFKVARLRSSYTNLFAGLDY